MAVIESLLATIDILCRWREHLGDQARAGEPLSLEILGEGTARDHEVRDVEDIVLVYFKSDLRVRSKGSAQGPSELALKLHDQVDCDHLVAQHWSAHRVYVARHVFVPVGTFFLKLQILLDREIPPAPIRQGRFFHA